jgi:hypothetical protein
MGRVLGFIGAIITVAVGMYFYSVQVKPQSPSVESGNSADVTTITGVKNDLIAIANAERGYFASQGKYASLDELVSGNYLTIKSERPPYVYNLEITDDSFRVTATRSNKGAPAQLWITSAMQIETSE